MEQNKERFYKLLLGFLIVITAMILFVKPPNQLKNMNIDKESRKLVSVVNLKNRIDDYRRQNKEYPKSLESFRRFYAENIDSLVEYKTEWDNYILRTKFEIDSARLILTKEGIFKEKNEEQNMGGD
ncbi:MAG: hypothetical protein PHW02_03340 [bacterium]|nr:hypothetical protein [bacterium]